MRHCQAGLSSTAGPSRLRWPAPRSNETRAGAHGSGRVDNSVQKQLAQLRLIRLRRLLPQTSLGIATLASRNKCRDSARAHVFRRLGAWGDREMIAINAYTRPALWCWRKREASQACRHTGGARRGSPAGRADA